MRGSYCSHVTKTRPLHIYIYTCCCLTFDTIYEYAEDPSLAGGLLTSTSPGPTVPEIV